MKKTLITLMLLAMTAVAWSQDNKVRIAELDSIGIMQFNNQQYDEALTTFQQELSLIQKEYGENDSLYVDDLAVISRCYFRQKAYKKALETGLKVSIMPTCSTMFHSIIRVLMIWRMPRSTAMRR